MTTLLQEMTFAECVARYANTAKHNDSLYLEFDRLTAEIDWLARHKAHVKEHALGYGEPAHHFMWQLLVRDLAHRFSSVRALEIGVYKGQAISLWSLIAKRFGLPVVVSAISPLRGNPVPRSVGTRIWKRLTSRTYRNDRKACNFYNEENYREIIGSLFSRFDLSLADVRLIEGFSNDPRVIAQVRDETFELVYIDGDHTFEVASQDIRNFGRLVVPGGFLVMDDASCFIPGNVFWKGHETVSRACEIIPALGFTNVLNVGHNRVYQRAR